MAVIEPTVEQFSNPVSKYLAATRPPFLLASFVPCLIGWATAAYSGVGVGLVTALLTLVGALVTHAGVNVLNDYYDELNGTDRANDERLFPFTGGSRFIQNGVLTPGQTLRFGAALMLVAALIGLALVPAAGPGLLGVGAVGLLIGWAYSAPPLALNAHGMGEVAVGLGFGTLITVGTDMVQRGGFDPLPLIASLPYALLVAALLYINQFPDWRADQRAGKRHWVVRLGPRAARWGYPTLVLGAYGWLLGAVGSGALPVAALAGLVGLPASLFAARELLRHAERPSRLVPAIRATIAALALHGAPLAAGLWLA